MSENQSSSLSPEPKPDNEQVKEFNNSPLTTIRVQADDFSLADEYQALIINNEEDGAVASFCGLVRNKNLGKNVIGLTLEHYPGMAEKALAGIVAQARTRWALGRVTVIHRFGTLSLGDQIVFVGVTSMHRGNAFAACEFIMDFLKTNAPFWKKERTIEGEHWIEARESDSAKTQSW